MKFVLIEWHLSFMTSNQSFRFLMRVFLVLILLKSCIVSSAQESMGITTSHYAGIHSAQLNPAMMVLSPLYIDVSIASFHAFVENNYIYFPGNGPSVSSYISGKQPIINSGPNKSYRDYYTNQFTQTRAGAAQNHRSFSHAGDWQARLWNQHFHALNNYAQPYASHAGQILF